jgi:hypothetical protein
LRLLEAKFFLCWRQCGQCIGGVSIGALGVGLDGLHRPGAVEQYSDERVLGIRHGNSMGRWKTAVSGYVWAPTTRLISLVAVSNQQTSGTLSDADGGARYLTGVA